MSKKGRFKINDSLKATWECIDHNLTFNLVGMVMGYHSVDLHSAIKDAMSNCDGCIKCSDCVEVNLDLSRIDMLDSRSLGSIVAINVHCATNNIKFNLINVPSFIDNTLSILNLDKIIDIKNVVGDD